MFLKEKLAGIFGVKLLLKLKNLIRVSYENKPFKKPFTDLDYFNGKNGIEIGGPSLIFSSEIPVYQVIKNLDGCNFSTDTIWEGKLTEGLNYNYFQDKKGYQYISEASNLFEVPDEKYDFLLASHCLEHCANTIKTLKEWSRVVKKDGLLLLILPDRNYTFDRNRPVTKFQHLIEDYKNEVNETDLTHIEEILAWHDLKMDIAAGSKKEFEERSKNNFDNRCLHHHIFDFDLLKKIFKYLKIETIGIYYIKPFHQVIIGKK